MGKSELILYQPDSAVSVEVRLEDENVWLNRQQIAVLFERDIKTIGKHINNALNEELAVFSTVANFATTAADGKVYQMEYYGLDVILSVGYRVKSSRGIQFRIWANRVLKNYLMKGYAVNKRLGEKTVCFFKNGNQTYGTFICKLQSISWNSSRRGAEEKALSQRLRRDLSAVFHAKDAKAQRTQREEGRGGKGCCTRDCLYSFLIHLVQR